MQKKWEYDVTVLDISGVEQRFTASELLRAIGDRGEKGWELVTVSTYDATSAGTDKIAFFWKREKPDAQKSKELTNQS